VAITKTKSGVDLPFKRLKGNTGSGILVADATDSVTFAADTGATGLATAFDISTKADLTAVLKNADSTTLKTNILSQVLKNADSTTLKNNILSQVLKNADSASIRNYSTSIYAPKASPRFTGNVGMAVSQADVALTDSGSMAFNSLDEQLSIHSGAGTTGEIAGEAVVSFIQTKAWSFDPKAVCDGSVDNLFLMYIGDEAPEGITIDEWKISFEADPTTEITTASLNYADAVIGLANAVAFDTITTVNGTVTEDTDANINLVNAGAPIPNGKVMYLKFNTAYTETGHQCILQIWYHTEED
jgi:hypothetical protein